MKAALCFLSVLAPTMWLAGSSCQRANAAGPSDFTIVPVGVSSIKVLKGASPYMSFDLIGWGPNWSWVGWEGTSRANGAAADLNATLRVNTGATLTLVGKVQSSAADAITLDIKISSDRDTDLTGLMLAIDPESEAFRGGAAKAGARTESLPMSRQGLGEAVAELSLAEQNGASTKVSIQPPTTVTSDGAIRVFLVGTKIRAGESVVKKIRVTLPSPSQFFADTKQVPGEARIDKWFVFQPNAPQNPTAPDELSLADWIEKPAGKHGRIARQGSQLVYNGQPMKLWGINVCYADCAPPKELAEQRAKFYARNGINAVRLHKYADGPGWAGIQSEGSFTKFDAAALDRIDYFVAKLREQGIFVKLSPTFGVKLGPEDLARVPYVSEFGSAPASGQRLETKHGAIFLSKELQKLQIEQTTNLLRHKNPYTGLTYAQDPAIAIVEMFNEDSALFYGTIDRLQNIPTLRKQTSKRFTQWLRQRYGTATKLIAAWGPSSLNSFAGEGFTNESWASDSIVPVGNPWFYDPEQLEGSQKPKAQRLLDTMKFYHELQNEFYDEFKAAVKASGYDGEMIGSNWIAGRGISHYYNLHSDYRVGMIDRHNYHGGGTPKMDDSSMLQRPGSGLLSMGLIQTANRPFSLSEWIHVFPNEWGSEGPAILGAYGMGLQGWDVSFMFQNRDSGTFADAIGKDQWEITTPQVMGMFPAVARQVLRGDVRESKLIIPRNVHLPSMDQGKLGFDDRASAAGDVKSADSATVPAEALAIGKHEIRFTESFTATPKFEVAPHIKNGQVLADGGQLGWTPGNSSQSGWFWLNSPGTQAVVGFAENKTADLADVSITSKNRYAAIYVSARGKSETLGNAKSLLITAFSRARNTGMKILGPLLISAGSAPLLIEPVVAEIALKRSDKATVHVLDHSGRRTGKTIPITNGKIAIDTGRDRAIYYLVTYG